MVYKKNIVIKKQIVSTSENLKFITIPINTTGNSRNCQYLKKVETFFKSCTIAKFEL